jgi:hypothetical protein
MSLSFDVGEGAVDSSKEEEVQPAPGPGGNVLRGVSRAEVALARMTFRIPLA